MSDEDITRGNEQITRGLTTALCDPGEMVTKYVAVAEIMSSNGCFRLAYSRDGVMPWGRRMSDVITGLRGGTRIEQEQPCVDCGKAVRVTARIDGNRAAMPEVLCAGCAPFRRLAEDLASMTGQSREAVHRLLSALAKPAPAMHRLLSALAKTAPVVDTTAARARIAHMAIGGAYPACPDRKDEE